jgi:two-component system chemotaxis response regulator CheY
MIEKFTAPDVTALVVEDDHSQRDLLVRLLEAMGAVKVFVAEEGGEGLRIAFEQQPAVVICDLEMKPIDGLALLGGIRSSLNTIVAGTPVVMFTANKDTIVAKRAKALGVSGYLVKPFNPKGFSGFITALLNRKAEDDA